MYSFYGAKFIMTIDMGFDTLYDDIICDESMLSNKFQLTLLTNSRLIRFIYLQYIREINLLSDGAILLKIIDLRNG